MNEHFAGNDVKAQTSTTVKAQHHPGEKAGDSLRSFCY
jgi:hypothetical protein